MPELAAPTFSMLPSITELALLLLAKQSSIPGGAEPCLARNMNVYVLSCARWLCDGFCTCPVFSSTGSKVSCITPPWLSKDGLRGLVRAKTVASTFPFNPNSGTCAHSSVE